MSQLESYQSIGGETRFKQDIRGGRNCQLIGPNHPHTSWCTRLSVPPIRLEAGMLFEKINDNNKLEVAARACSPLQVQERWPPPAVPPPSVCAGGIPHRPTLPLAPHCGTLIVPFIFFHRFITFVRPAMQLSIG